MILPSNYTLIRKDVRHARIRVNEDREIRIIIPNNFSVNDIEDLLRKKQKWISKSLDYFNRERNHINLKDNEILYLGESFKLDITKAKKTDVDFTNKIIYLPLNLKSRTRRLKWYKDVAKIKIKERVDFYGSIHKYRYNRIFIRNQRTKWGSCSSKRNLSFNWRLILCPLLVLDYLVCHELVHTSLMKHNKMFWVELRTIYPETERAQTWLNKYSNEIFRLTR